MGRRWHLIWKFLDFCGWNIRVNVYPIDFGLILCELLLGVRISIRRFSINSLGSKGFLRLLQPSGADQQSH